MRVAYLDCFSGVSGDMLLGAMLDAGLSLDELQGVLAGLPLEGWSLSAQKVTRSGISATHAVVDVRNEQPTRTLEDILRIVADARLLDADKERAAAVFRRLAEAEASVHGEAVEAVHMHDVGAVDAIVDVVGAVAGLRMLGAERLYCSALPLGEGEVRGPHGVLPVPAPATLALLAGAAGRVRAGALPHQEGTRPSGELVTPTGAAIVTTLAEFERPEMTVDAVGYGAGTRDPEDRPNVLRLWLGEADVDSATRPMLLIESNIDDMTPEMLAYVQSKLLAEGAADAWLTPVAMKKGRSAVVLSVICAEADEERVARLLLRETSTLGVRVRPVHRWEAEREVFDFESSLGPAAVKVKRLPGERSQIAPEFESCRSIAEARDIPVAEVYRVVEAEARRALGE